MDLNADVICPCCKKQTVNLIGKLPNCNWFAGKQLIESLLGGNLYRCADCNLKFRYPVLPEETYLQLYDNSSTETWSLEALRPDWKMTVNHIHTNFSKGGKVLDFGCYNGGLLTKLDGHYQKFGIEINKSSAKIAEVRNQAKVWQTIEEVPNNFNFDIIIATDVIEHVANPALLINQLMKMLSNDGVLLITTGDADNYLWNKFGANWWYCFFPEHIAFISKRWLDYFISEHQKQVVHIENFNYLHLSKPQLFIHLIKTMLYGIFPTIYLKFGKLKNMILNSNARVIPKGVGVSSDHIFVVLRN